METASISIKFTPLIQNVQKNESKCFLEIVPEVTCIQNLDKIEWQSNSDFIEYIIPITYKVILRKRQSVKETKHDLEKIYHSCVDLIPPSSLSYINPACGDVTKMISDTVIFSVRGNLNSDKFSIKSNEFTLDSINDVELEDEPLTQKNNPCDSVHKLGIDSSYNLTATEDQNEDVIRKADASTSQIHIKVVGKETNDVNTMSVDNIDRNINNAKVASIETVTEQSYGSSSSNKKDSARKLTLTPICSIDTNDNYFKRENIELLTWNSILHRILEHQNVIRTAKITDLSPNYNYSKVNKKNEIICKDSLEASFCNRERPEVKVAKFVKNMEAEILPLKLMLCEIYEKCSSLGLIKTQINDNVNSLSHEDDTSKQLIKYCVSEKQIKSNRVVYSIVCDE